MTPHDRLTAVAAIGLERIARTRRLESRERPTTVDPAAWDEALLVALEDLWAWEEREVRKVMEEK